MAPAAVVVVALTDTAAAVIDTSITGTAGTIGTSTGTTRPSTGGTTTALARQTMIAIRDLHGRTVAAAAAAVAGAVHATPRIGRCIPRRQHRSKSTATHEGQIGAGHPQSVVWASEGTTKEPRHVHASAAGRLGSPCLGDTCKRMRRALVLLGRHKGQLLRGLTLREATGHAGEGWGNSQRSTALHVPCAGQSAFCFQNCQFYLLRTQRVASSAVCHFQRTCQSVSGHRPGALFSATPLPAATASAC